MILFLEIVDYARVNRVGLLRQYLNQIPIQNFI